MAAFTYNNFVEFVKNEGLANQNRFEVDLVLPNALVAAGFNTRNAALLVKNVNIPGVNVATNNVVIVGEPLTLAWGRTFGEATVTFYVDRKFLVRQIFEKWVDAIQNPDTRLLGWYQDTISNIKINVMDEKENINFAITLYEAKPKSLGPVQLDQGNQDVMTFDVTFDYRNYKTEFLASDQSLSSYSPSMPEPDISVPAVDINQVYRVVRILGGL